MKQLLLIFFTVSTIYANYIKWQGNYDKALQKARAENKILMVLLIKNNCQKCKNAVKELGLMNKTYINALNQKVIAVIVNIDNRQSFPLEMYWSNKYPTLFFVNSKNETFIYKPFYNITKNDIENILVF